MGDERPLLGDGLDDFSALSPLLIRKASRGFLRAFTWKNPVSDGIRAATFLTKIVGSGGTSRPEGGYFKGEEILACEATGVTPLVPKPLTSGAKADGRFGKQDFVYDAGEDVYRCPAGETLTWRYWNVEAGRKLHNYWTTKCGACALKSKCTPAKERRVKRWEHEAVVDAMQERLERAPETMRIRRQTAEHPFGTIKA